QGTRDANARMIPVRHRSYATYSRQPRQVRKEATVTGSYVCSEPPVPGLIFCTLHVRPSGYQDLHSLYDSFARNSSSRHQQKVGAARSSIGPPARTRMKNRIFPKTTPHVTIRVSGTLFQGHLLYL